MTNSRAIWPDEVNSYAASVALQEAVNRGWLTDEQLKNGNMAKIFGLSLVLAFLAAWNFANFLGPRPSIAFGAGVGASAGLLWVASSFGINYLFERKSFKLFAINGGYHTLQFTIFGLVLALMPCKDCAEVACAQ